MKARLERSGRSCQQVQETVKGCVGWTTASEKDELADIEGIKSFEPDNK